MKDPAVSEIRLTWEVPTTQKPPRYARLRKVVAVAAAVGLAAGGYATARRWSRLAETYRFAADREATHVQAWVTTEAVRLEGVRQAIRLKEEAEKAVGDTRRTYWSDADYARRSRTKWGKLIESLDRQIEDMTADAADAHRARDYCQALRDKYLYVSSHPWSRVDPDPPHPTVYDRSDAEYFAGTDDAKPYVETKGQTRSLKDRFRSVHVEGGAP